MRADELSTMVPLYPLPVGIAVGRVVREHQPAERMIAVLAAGEVLSRYVAVASLASAASRDDIDLAPDIDIEWLDPSRPLAWGKFNYLARQAMSTPSEHPLRSVLARGLGLARSNEPSGIDALETMVRVRNANSAHSLSAGGSTKASALLDGADGLEAQLLVALESFDPLLRLPLIVIEEQRILRRREAARVSLLIGEHVPFPFEIEASGPADDNEPYIVTSKGLVALAPGLIWTDGTGRWAPEAWFLDSSSTGGDTYRGLHSDESMVTAFDSNNDALAWLVAEPHPLDQLTPPDGRSLAYAIRQTLATEVAATVSAASGGASDPVEAELPLPEITDDARQHAGAKYRRHTIPELVDRARALGLAEPFEALLGAAEAVGLTPRPFTHGVMMEPPEKGNRYLMWFGMHETRNPYLKVSINRDRIAERFGLSSDRVTELLGPDRRLTGSDSPDELIMGIGRLNSSDEANAEIKTSAAV